MMDKKFVDLCDKITDFIRNIKQMFSNVAHYTLLCLFGKIHGTQKSNINLNSLVFDEFLIQIHWFGFFFTKKESLHFCGRCTQSNQIYN